MRRWPWGWHYHTVPNGFPVPGSGLTQVSLLRRGDRHDHIVWPGAHDAGSYSAVTLTYCNQSLVSPSAFTARIV